MQKYNMRRLKADQGGFTLLELLVVITLIATLATAALVAYDGIGDSAQATAASNSTATADGAIRNYRAVTQNYPDQWDNLVVGSGAAVGTAPDFLAATTRQRLANWVVPASTTGFGGALNTALNAVGITTLQQRAVATATAGIEPNLQHNEGAVNRVAPGEVTEDNIGVVTNIAILPTFGDPAVAAGACSVNGTALGNKLDNTAMAATDGNRQNVINDALESDECNLVIALGFGHDAAHSTDGSSVAISTAPTFVNQRINPANNYARYIALFNVGRDEDGDNNIVQGGTCKTPKTERNLWQERPKKGKNACS